METLIKITDLTERLGLSSRTLRYYEQAGLIKSVRPQFEKYRFFDEKNVERLKQIVVLRKMQIPIRDLQRIYESEDMQVLVYAFVRRIDEIEGEITALSELKKIVDGFLRKMLQNGITKISAIPLLYEEMNKQLLIAEESEKVTMDTLNDIGKRLKKRIETRIVKLSESNMLCSKSIGSDVSDPNGFFELLDRKGILGEVGGNRIFELRTEDGETLIVAEKSEKLQSSGYSDYRLVGGLFAAANTYADEDIDEFYREVVGSFDENRFYQVDYSRDGLSALIESVLSPDGRRDMVDLLVPIKPRVPDSSFFEETKRITGISVEEIENANPILETTEIKSYTPLENPYYEVNDEGITVFNAYISVRRLSTDVAVKIPFRVDMEFMEDAKTEQFAYGADEGSMRIDFGNSYFGINMENSPDRREQAIKFTEPMLGNIVILPKLGRIVPNKYNRVTWIIGEKHFAVIINGEVRYCATDMPYMNMDLRLQEAFPIIIGSNGQSVKYIKTVKVSQLRQSPTLKITGGKPQMDKSRSNNTIPSIHRTITMHYGENYWFNGCASYVMESLGQPDYNYGFFAGLTGDNFTQIYAKKDFYGDSATDILVKMNGGAYIEELFDKIGYSCSYVPNKKLKGNRDMYLQSLISYIDKGVPVLRYHWFWSVIVGYEDFGKTLLVMQSDKEEPEKIAFDEIFELTDKTSDKEADDYGYGWFFVGEKTREVSLAEAYRIAVEGILPRLLMSGDTFAFGANAFRAWADDLENGKFDGMTAEQYDDWPLYTCYVCNLATNSGCGRDFLIKASELNPDLEFLSDIIRLYAHTGEMWNNQGGGDLEALGGGFNITLDALQDKEKCAKIIKKIRDFAATADKIIELFKSNTDEQGKLRPIQTDLTAVEDIKYFKTVNVTDWVKSPFVPNFNGRIKTDEDANGNTIKCWYIDSLKGKWSTVYSTIENVKQGEKIRLLFWAKFAEGGHHEIIDWTTQTDWNKHVEFYMNECKPHLLGKRGAYCLFTAIYTAVEDGTVQFSLSANDVIVSLYPAEESDLQAFSEENTAKPQSWRITKCYKESFPKCRFVGKKYGNKDRVDGMFSAHWGDWHANDWFRPLEEQITKKFKKAYPDCEAYVGLMKNKYGAPDDYFEYWIGMFLPEDCTIPEGYQSLEIIHDTAGICWIKGQEWDVYCHEGECYGKICESGMTIPSEEDGGCYMFERYQCPRITCPDENGEVILDLGFFVEKSDRVKDITELKSSECADDKLEFFNLPDSRVIGKSMRVPLNRHGAKNPMPKFWKDITKDGSMEVIKSLPKLFPGLVGFTDDYDAKTDTFLYIAGAICPIGTPVPEGYTVRDIPATIVSKSINGDWLKQCKPIWELNGYEWSGSEGQYWNAELYLDGEEDRKFRLLCAVMKK